MTFKSFGPLTFLGTDAKATIEGITSSIDLCLIKSKFSFPTPSDIGTKFKQINFLLSFLPMKWI